MKEHELPEARPHTLDTVFADADTGASPIPLVATSHASDKGSKLEVLRAGQLVCGVYQLDSNLGEGGMGVVWAATHVLTGARAALKFLKVPKDAEEEARRRLLREARVGLAIAHPSVVAIQDVLVTAEQEPILVMELLEGESFRETLDREGRIDIATLSRWLLPAISAIGTAHSLGIVHRDIKPENLYLARATDGSQSLKVLDFGIAKLTANIGPAAKTALLTGKGIMIGTPLYMAPEQMMCEPSVDHRADIWSLGIVLYEALTGILPTEASTIGKSVSRLLGNITPIELVAPTLPCDTSRLVGRMLAAAPAHRPVDLREVFATLLPYAGGLRCDGFGPASPRSVD